MYMFIFNIYLENQWIHKTFIDYYKSDHISVYYQSSFQVESINISKKISIGFHLKALFPMEQQKRPCPYLAIHTLDHYRENDWIHFHKNP